MKKEEMEDIVHHSFKILHKLLHKVIMDFDGDDIDDFRVEVKKLRALLKVINTNSQLDKPLIPYRLRTFYGYLGIIRNFQLQRQWLMEYAQLCKTEIPKSYLNIISEEQCYWQKQAIELMAEESFADDESIILKQLPDKLEKSSAKQYFESEADKLRQRLKHVKRECEIHAVRQILRNILYAQEQVEEWGDVSECFLNYNSIKLLTGQLSDFEDRCVLLNLLKPEFTKRVGTKDERDALTLIKEIIQKQKTVMLDSIKQRLANFLMSSSKMSKTLV